MAIQYEGDAILFTGSDVSMDPACCCGQSGTSCCCPALDVPTPPDLHLTIASSCAKIDGLTLTMTPTAPTHGGCRAWAGSINLDCNGTTFPWAFVVECMGRNGNCNDYHLWHAPQSSSCTIDSGDQDVAPSSCSCDPLSLVYTNLDAPAKRPADPVGSPCDCCTTADTFTVTITL